MLAIQETTATFAWLVLQANISRMQAQKLARIAQATRTKQTRPLHRLHIVCRVPSTPKQLRVVNLQLTVFVRLALHSTTPHVCLVQPVRTNLKQAMLRVMYAPHIRIMRAHTRMSTICALNVLPTHRMSQQELELRHVNVILDTFGKIRLVVRVRRGSIVQRETQKWLAMLDRPQSRPLLQLKIANVYLDTIKIAQAMYVSMRVCCAPSIPTVQEATRKQQRVHRMPPPRLRLVPLMSATVSVTQAGTN